MLSMGGENQRGNLNVNLGVSTEAQCIGNRHADAYSFYEGGGRSPRATGFFTNPKRGRSLLAFSVAINMLENLVL